MKKNRCALAYANAPLDTQWGKRILSTLLAVVLCVGLLPGAAFAAYTYTPADVDAVLERVVTNDVEVDKDNSIDMAYDADGDGTLTSKDAKKILEELPPLNNLELNKDELSLPVGAMTQLTVSYEPNNTYQTKVIWESNNEAVATVDENGLVTAKEPGTATITVRSADADKLSIVDTCTITVSDTPLPTISANAMQITAKRDTNWVNLSIRGGRLDEDGTTTINKFNGTLDGLFEGTFYPMAAALEQGKLVLRVSHDGDDSLIQVDPDSFVARKLTLQPDEYGSNYSWYDATTLSDLSDGRLLSVYHDPTSNNKVRFSLMDGEKVLASSAPENAPYLVGIAAAGTDTDGNETLYGITRDGDLYSFTLNESDDGNFSIGSFDPLGDDVFPFYLGTKYFSSASLLYDNASGYLLVAVTYMWDVSGTTDPKNVGYALYLIDPQNPNFYVPVSEAHGVVLNSLYQHTQVSEGVQVYLTADKTSVKVGSTIKATAEAYQFSTDNGLVTNSKIDTVTWTSNDTDVATVKNGVVTGVAQGEATITAKATATINGTACEGSKSFKVTVTPDTGLNAKVGALLDTSRGSAWVEIALNSVDGDQKLTGITVKNKIQGLDPVGGGYADGKLWGAVSTNLYAFDNGGNGTEVTTVNSSDNVIDLTDAPKITTGSQTVKDPACAVFATYSGQIGVLKSDKNYSLLWDAGGDFKISAIAYVGDLTVAQFQDKFTNELNGYAGAQVCHVYYALSRDATGGATLRQIILVPKVNANGDFDGYSLCGITIGTVAAFNDTETTNRSTSIDFLDMGDDGFGLLVARSNKGEGFNDICYIDLTNYTVGSETSENKLTVKKIGALTSVDGATISRFSALYHTDGAKMTDEQILKVAGWNPQTSRQSAPVAARAVSVQTGGDTTDPAASTTKQIEVPVYAAPATNGKWTVTYDPNKLTYDDNKSSWHADIVYTGFHNDGKGSLTLAFASKTTIESSKEQPLFTLVFTTNDSTMTADSVKVTCNELNNDVNKAPSKPSGGGGGGSTGSATSPVTPAQPDNGSVSVDKKNAAQGDTVTITVQPDEGYVPGTVKVVDKDGKEIAVKDLGNGKYSFVMPTGKVDVRVTFAPATGGFTDVPADAYYREAVLWAVEKGVTNGVSETLFGPDGACTRA